MNISGCLPKRDAKVSLREIAATNCGAELEDWKAKYEAEQRLYSAAREVAIGIANRNLIGERTKPETVALDYSAEALPSLTPQSKRR
jgi:hypothetical protein